MVNNGRDAPVRVEVRVPWLLLDVLADVDALYRVLLAIRFLELFE